MLEQQNTVRGILHCFPAQRFDDDFPQPRQRNDDDKQNRNHRRRSRDAADVAESDLGQRFPAPPQARAKHQKILHRPRQTYADHDPQQPRHIPELCRQHRPDQRSGAADCREMMAEKYPFVRRMIILPIVESHRRRDTAVVEHGDFRREEGAVIAIRDRQDAEHDDHHGHCGHDVARATRP